MIPYLDDGDVTVYLADCFDAMRQMPAESVDAIVTDPPYGIGFMGKAWDGKAITDAVARDRDTRPSLGPESASRPGRAAPRSKSAYGGESSVAGAYDFTAKGNRAFQEWSEAWAREALRVAKPGAHLASFGGTRTWHRLRCGVEDAGWDVRDSLMWLYGSGFPKSLNVTMAVDKAACKLPAGMDVPATPEGEAWAGWGTALKPAWEPIVLARKPLVGTVAANVLRHGTGALNIDACRIGFASDADEDESKAKNRHADYGSQQGSKHAYGDYSMVAPKNYNPPGRWPANVVLDEDAAALLDEQTGERPGATSNSESQSVNAYGKRVPDTRTVPGYGDTGGASRFFYTAKADSEERQAPDGTRNTHPTVKPTDLMRWLVRLIVPPGGVVLDPFAGSGSTGVACRAESVRCILVEREAEYAAIIAARLSQQSLLGVLLDGGATS